MSEEHDDEEKKGMSWGAVVGFVVVGLIVVFAIVVVVGYLSHPVNNKKPVSYGVSEAFIKRRDAGLVRAQNDFNARAQLRENIETKKALKLKQLKVAKKLFK